MFRLITIVLLISMVALQAATPTSNEGNPKGSGYGFDGTYYRLPKLTGSTGILSIITGTPAVASPTDFEGNPAGYLYGYDELTPAYRGIAVNSSGSVYVAFSGSLEVTTIECKVIQAEDTTGVQLLNSSGTVIGGWTDEIYFSKTVEVNAGMEARDGTIEVINDMKLTGTLQCETLELGDPGTIYFSNATIQAANPIKVTGTFEATEGITAPTFTGVVSQAATIESAIALKAPLASPLLTGTVGIAGAASTNELTITGTTRTGTLQVQTIYDAGDGTVEVTNSLSTSGHEKVGTYVDTPAIGDYTDGIMNIATGIACMGAANFNSDGGDIDTQIQADSGVALYVDATSVGKVGIKTSTPPWPLSVVGKIGTMLSAADDTTLGLTISTTEAQISASYNTTGHFKPMSFYTSDTLRMAISEIGIITMSAYGAGTATFSAAGVISSVSDERLKNIKAPFKTGLEAIHNINPILYTWKDSTKFENEKTKGTIYAGFSAQNVQKHIPEAIGKNADGTLSVQDRAIMAAMVNAIKELEARIIVLEGK